jgi:hypothetical protein
MKFKLLFAVSALAAVFSVGCANPEAGKDATAIKAVEAMGFSNATVVRSGLSIGTWDGCSEQDTFYFDVTATNPTGKRVNLTVCTDFTKGSTVRVR